MQNAVLRNLVPLFLLLAFTACAKPSWTGSAQDFTFQNFATGQPTKLSSYAGKPVVLNFWADW